MIRESRAALRYALFDLDGTLIDSTDLIIASYDHTYRAHGRLVQLDQIRAALGMPLQDTLAQHFRGAELRDAMSTYLEYNLNRHDEAVRTMAGVAELVRRLRNGGLRLGVVTSKLRESARRGLTLCNLDNVFEVIVAKEDTTRHKPECEPLLYALAALDAEAGEAAYVGDSPLDVEAADAAGVRSIAALWRPVSESAFSSRQPDAYARTPAEAADILEAWRDGREYGLREERLQGA